MTHAWLRAGMLLVAATLLCACGGGSDDGGSNPPPPPPPPPPGSGLDARPSNASCLAPDRTTGTLTIGTQRAFPSLSFDVPIAFMQAPGDNSRWFVVEQSGNVRTFLNDPAASASTVFVNATGVVRYASGSEMGLLGMAFHPDWPNDARVFLSYTAGTNPLVLRIAEFESLDGGQTLPPTPARTILTINKSNNESNHNGGNIAFGPDGSSVPRHGRRRRRQRSTRLDR